VLLLVFAGVVLVSLSLLSFLERTSIIKKRLGDPAGAHEQKAAAPTSLFADQQGAAWIQLINAIERAGLSLSDTKNDQLRSKLASAGYVHPYAPRMYSLVRLVLTVALPALYIFVAQIFGSDLSLTKLYIFGTMTALLGLYIPSLVIRSKAEKRRQALTNGFPDAMDLMLVCVEAGLGLEAAFSRVGSEMTRSHPLIAEVFGSVVLELRAGRSREDALRRMADRVGVEEIRSFATLLIQSTRLGSSIAQTLRVYSAEMREQRRMRAEEKAHRLPVLLSIPLVVCMLPVMIGILMLPAAIRVIRQLIPAMGGG
jgi:tight adherence protein C